MENDIKAIQEYAFKLEMAYIKVEKQKIALEEKTILLNQQILRLKKSVQAMLEIKESYESMLGKRALKKEQLSGNVVLFERKVKK